MSRNDLLGTYIFGVDFFVFLKRVEREERERERREKNFSLSPTVFCLFSFFCLHALSLSFLQIC